MGRRLLYPVCLVAIALAQQAVDKDLFDCDVGLDNYQVDWTEAKREWCCENKGKGCQQDFEQPAAATDGEAATPQAAAVGGGAAGAGAGTPPSPPPPPPLPPPVPPAPERVLSPSPPPATTTSTTTLGAAASQAASAAAAQKSQSDLNIEFIRAATTDRDMAKVQSILARRADLNAVETIHSFKGSVLYHLAHSSRNADPSAVTVAKELITLRADLDFADGRGRNALFLATAQGNKDLVLALKDTKNKNPAKGSGATALQIAVRNGHEEIAKALLDIGADKVPAAVGEAKNKGESMRRLMGYQEEL